MEKRKGVISERKKRGEKEDKERTGEVGEWQLP
jgi:hypothetical protein